MNKLPRYLIVGQMKCGTTGLYWTLTQGDSPFLPAMKKELMFFDNNYNKGIINYESWFPDCDSGQILGESSPSYFVRPDIVIPRIKKVIPNVDIIIMLRNPVTRAYSQFQHYLKNSYKFKNLKYITKDFFKFIHQYKGRKDELHWMGQDLLERSIYMNYIPKWIESFGRNQVTIIKAEEYFKYPQRFVTMFCDKYKVPRFEIKESLNINKGIYKEPMDLEAKLLLKKYFEPHNKKLYLYLHRDFEWEDEL